MRAEKTVNGISRDYMKAAREMAIIKNRWDREREEYRAKQEAEEKGRAEGMAEGMDKGRAEGMAEGKLEIARKLKQMGLSIPQIVEGTGLSPETIREL